MKDKNIVILWVENKPGVLMKISSLCRRRRYNIDSLTVGATHQPGISHITMVFQEDKERLKNIINQLNKLIEVISVEALESKDVIDKELILIIVNNEVVADKLLKQTTHDVSVRVLNTVDNHPVLEIVGEGNEIDHILDSIDMKKDVTKLVRSGLIAIKI